MDKRLLAIFAATGASAIYGLNHTIAKGVMPSHIEAFGFIMLRVLGAAILFWILSPFAPKEKVEKKDWQECFAVPFLVCALICYSFLRV